MKYGSLFVILAAAAGSAGAGTLLSFGLDQGSGAPAALAGMDPSSAGSVAIVASPLGGGSIAFNGGLVAIGTTLYALGNDTADVASLYSFQADGSGLSTIATGLNNSGGGSGYFFLNGLGAIGNNLYGIGVSSSTSQANLFQIGAGGATSVAALNSLGGGFAGMAYDPDAGLFYAIIANGTSNSTQGDFLVSFAPDGSNFTIVANLSALDGTSFGDHLGGLAYGGAGVFYDIFTDADPSDANFLLGQLEQFTLAGTSTATLYNTGVPFMQNAGVASIPAVPEPSTFLLVGIALLSLAKCKRPKIR